MEQQFGANSLTELSESHPDVALNKRFPSLKVLKVVLGGFPTALPIPNLLELVALPWVSRVLGAEQGERLVLTPV